MRRRIRYTALVAALVATTIPAQTADAQLGRLKKIGADIAKDAAGVPAVEQKKTASRDIVITAERLDAVLLALAPRIEAAKVEHDAKAASKEFETWQTTFNTCVETTAKANGMPSAEGLEAANKITMKMAPLMERMGKLAAGNDKRAYEYIQDTLRVLGSESQQLMFNAGRCGKVRYTPTAIIEQKVAAASRRNTVVDESGIRWDIEVPADKRAGMSHYQFGMVRERMALYALIQEGVIPADKAGKDGVFSDAEKSALSARSADLKALAPLFKTGSMRWTSWGDITSW
jgi:hypothetical protein